MDFYANLKNDDIIDLKGYIQNIKPSKKFWYVYIANKDGIFPTLFREDLIGLDFSLLKVGMYVDVKAIIKDQQRAKSGKELNLKSIKILSSPSKDISYSAFDKEFNFSAEDTVKNKLSLIKHPYLNSIYKFQNGIIKAFEDFMYDNNFIRTFTPTLINSPTYDTFMLDYFDNELYLPFSPHIYMSAAVSSLERVFEVSHSFSAKKFNSTRHLNEFISLNFLQGYTKTLDDIIETVKRYLIFTMDFLDKNFKDELDFFNVSLPTVTDIPVYTFNEALEILNKPTQPDLDPTDIRKLCDYVKSNSGNSFVIVKNFPDANRPVCARSVGDLFLSCFDLYFSGLKIATGYENIYEYDAFLNKCPDITNNKAYSVYLETIKNGIMPFSSFMLGLERFTMQLLNLPNIRYASMFPRDIHNIMP